MASRSESIFRVRSLLDNPYLQAPNFHSLLRQTLSDEQDLITDLNNTGQPWTVAEYTLNYFPGQAYFTIQEQNIGKILYVVRLTGNPYIPALPVPFQDLNTLNYGTLWNSFYNLYNGWGAYALSETIEQMAFYRTGVTDQEIRVQIQPAPQYTAQYVISYLVGPVSEDSSLETQAALPEFATLIQLRSATALLPYTQWSEDRVKDLDRKKELAQAFAYQLARKERNLAEYKSNLVTPRTVEVSSGFY